MKHCLWIAASVLLSGACAFERYGEYGNIATPDVCKAGEIDLLQAKALRWALVDDVICAQTSAGELPYWDARAYSVDYWSDRKTSTRLSFGDAKVIQCDVKLTQAVNVQSFASMVALLNRGDGALNQRLQFAFVVNGQSHTVVAKTSHLGRNYKLSEWMSADDDSSTTIPLPFSQEKITSFSVAISKQGSSSTLYLGELRLCATLADGGDLQAAKQIAPFKAPPLKESYVTRDYDNVYWGAHQDSGTINVAQLLQLKDDFLGQLQVKAINGASDKYNLMWDRKATPLYTLTASETDVDDRAGVHITFRPQGGARQGNFRLLLNGKCTVRGLRYERSTGDKEALGGSLSVNSQYLNFETNSLYWKGMRSWTNAQNGYSSFDILITAQKDAECNIGELEFLLDPLEGSAMYEKVISGHYRGRTQAPWPSPWDNGWNGLQHATFTERGPWISAVCFECDTVSPELGDYVQIVGKKDDLIGSTLFYEVNDKNVTLAAFTESELTATEDGNCLWLVSKKTQYPGALKCSGQCDFSRTELRRFFLMSADKQPQAVFVSRPYRTAADEEIVQVRTDRSSEALAFSRDWKPNFYSQSCDADEAQQRQDDNNDNVAAIAAISSVAALASIAMNI